ncbi:hypothetical protein HNV11_08385 [Spirosoma taeanense]|uniref:Uncharacterized protein n=1 Tax=Spirosoma taeanense TaxID=2735870 RepID=A0A6M5Y7Y2_9BACT|nr:hypothetical protein [Spirosoma taeanense]QJW89400.1 hypothetical protein HNV11_08385 [Spirosoma taeanense]
MSTSEIIGIVLTVVFGIPSVIGLLQSLPSRLTLLMDERLNLYSNVSKNIQGLDITFKGNKINKDFYLIKASFFYQGRKDVLKEQINQPLSLELPEGSIIHDFNILSKEQNLDITVEVRGNQLLFDFDLLKNSDYIYFQIFAEIGDFIEDKLVARHRIANVNKKIKTIRYIDYEIMPKKLFGNC